LTLDLIARAGDVMAAARQFNGRANVEDIANGPLMIIKCALFQISKGLTFNLELINIKKNSG